MSPPALRGDLVSALKVLVKRFVIPKAFEMLTREPCLVNKAEIKFSQSLVDQYDAGVDALNNMVSTGKVQGEILEESCILIDKLFDDIKAMDAEHAATQKAVHTLKNWMRRDITIACMIADLLDDLGVYEQ